MARGKCRWLKYGPPEDLSNGVMDGWSKLGVQATELDRFVHGTAAATTPSSNEQEPTRLM